jgi:hypothetical protein
MPDMRDILLMAKGDAPPARHSVDEIIAAGQRRRRRAFAYRVGGAGMVAAAVATAAVLVSVNLTVAGSQGTVVQPAVAPPAPTTPAPSPPFTFTFDGYQVGGYRVLAPDEVTPAYQAAGVMRDVAGANGKVTTRYAGSLTVYQPGLFDPARFRTGTRLTVHGREAFQARFERQLVGTWDRSVEGFTTPGSPTPKTFTIDALAWQYAPDAWAVLEGELSGDANGFPAADQLTVAERFAVASGDLLRARLPFQTRYLPAGFTLRSVSGQSMNAEHRGMTTFVYAEPRPSGARLTGPRDPAPGRQVTSVVVSILWVDRPPADAAKRTSRCNPGQHWCMRTLPGGRFWVAVEDPSKTLSDQELLKVADGLAFATIEDNTTWFPAA